MKTIYTSNLVPSLNTAIAQSAISKNIVTEQVGGNLQISTLDFHLDEEKVMHFEGPATFCIAVFLNGSGELSIDSGKALKIEPNMTVVFHSSENVKGRTVFAADSHLHCLDMRYSLEYLSSFGLANLDLLIPMFEHNHSVASITMLAKPTSIKLKMIVKDILECEMTGVARSLYLQGKGLEALAYILNNLEQRSAAKVKLSRQDHLKVQQAIKLLEQHYEQPWTIARLSKEVGLNQSKLKQGFHLAVQSTVHNYLEEVRLRTAQQLLEQGNKVIDVCIATGYSNPSHFSKRFKQRFTVKPSQWTSFSTLT